MTCPSLLQTLALVMTCCLSVNAFGQDCTPAHQAILAPADGQDSMNHGLEIALSGTTIVAGARLDNELGEGAGAAYVYELIDTEWIQTAKLLISNGTTGDRAGHSVAISGDTIIVGVPQNGDYDNLRNGKACIFVRSATGWVEQATIVASDGKRIDAFGFSVGIDGNTTVVGAPVDGDGDGGSIGSVYVFNRLGTAWTEHQKLISMNAESGDLQGYSVAISGKTIISGTRGATHTHYGDGEAIVFELNSSVWSEKSELFAPNGAQNDWFGYNVDVSNNQAIVGSIQNGTGPGAAYIYERQNGDWNLVQLITPFDPDDAGFFGYSVSIDGEFALVGDRYHSAPNSGLGAAYLYQKINGSWEFQSLMKALNTVVNSSFATSVDLDAQHIAIGNPGAYFSNIRSGTVVVFFDSCLVSCIADVNGDGSLTAADFTAWINAFNNNLPECDQNGDGNCTSTDFTAWVANFNAGC